MGAMYDCKTSRYTQKRLHCNALPNPNETACFHPQRVDNTDLDIYVRERDRAAVSEMMLSLGFLSVFA